MNEPTPSRKLSTADVTVVHLLAASALGVYLLLVVGATTAVLDGATACPTWPACDGRWLVPLEDPALVAAWSHRVLTLVVGGLVVATLAISWHRGADRRVRRTLGATALLYPGQVGIGALTTVTAGSTPLSALHLVVAMAIFTGLIAALLWQLESETTTTVTATAAGSTPTDRPGSGPEQASRGGPDSGQADGAGGDHDPVDGGGPAEGATPRFRAYLELTKPKLMWLLCLVALAAMGLAAGPALDPGRVLATLTGGVLAIGASGTFNNVLERDVDRRMARTADRPLVRGQIPVRRAVAFGCLLTAGSVGVFLAFVNALAAALGLLAILFYSVVYTLLLKPRTSKNIVIGGAVGAFPALIGWAAVEGTVGIPAVVLGAVIFLWTPAHFYNLALAYREDYARAGFPMLPVVRGAATTRRHVLLYLGATLLGSVVLGATTRLGWPYAVTTVLVGGVFLWAVVRLFREQTERAAFRTFHASNAYLGGLLLAVLVDTIVL